MRPLGIAIIGIASHLPGARNLDQFWRNLRDGVESIRDLSDRDLLAAGATRDELANPDYVKRAAVLDDVALFDASFFGFSPRDASIMDPQHRHFLECAWEALEDAGYPPSRFDGSIGVFAGSGMSTYLIHNLLANRRLLESSGLFQLKQTGNDKDVLATRVSYQLDLRGPSINVQTACSTSLVAVHLACQSLLNSECDMALAGGVTIEFPHGLGYVHREGEILSRDGHCRSFDAASSGTIFASGAGVVVLRRLDEALKDRDNIHAVILGAAINNDGARKVGYLAPSVEGQAEVISEALNFAGVSAADISYVEAHGTGTIVGDPIEIRALTSAFRKSTTRSGYCGIGSLKSNVGHLDAAAGVAGLIKTILALKHGQLPATLHFQNPNPNIEFEDSPFFVNDRLRDWPASGSPRRAGVTSLGIGGTNAHVVLEEAPEPALLRQPRPCELLVVSARSDAAAEQALSNLAAHLKAHPELNLADVAFTCQLGRQAFSHRRAMPVENTADAIAGLAIQADRRVFSGVAARSAPDVVFMFSGQGSQYVNMGRVLYRHERVFSETLDLCAQKLKSTLGVDLIQSLYPPEADKEAAAERLNQTWLTQPALFSIEYSLARWWMSLGVHPAAMVGHSIGEYVAACVAGVFSLDDALAIVAARGRLIYDLPSGTMLAVPLAASEVSLNGTLSLAAVNSPEICIVSGPTGEIAALEESLAKQSLSCRRLFTSHAFHSAMMDPILGDFEERLRSVAFHPPRIPYLSNVSGTWIKPEEATDPGYWARHIRHTVRFADCLSELFRKPERILIEAGPGNALSSLARQQGGTTTRAYPSLPHPREAVSDYGFALATLGRLWVGGVSIDWAKLHARGSVQRVSLPTYPFEREKFWIEPDKPQPLAPSLPESTPLTETGKDLCFYRRTWKSSPLAPDVAAGKPSRWLIFADALGLGSAIVASLEAGKEEAILVQTGSGFKKSKGNRYTVRPGVREDYESLIADVIQHGHSPRKVLHLWSVTVAEGDAPLDETLDRSFYSPLYLAQALAAQDLSDIEMALVSNRLQQVSSESVRDPARAVLLGPTRVIPRELPGNACRSIDVDFKNGKAKECAAQLVAEMAFSSDGATVAYRAGERFIEILDPFDLHARPERRCLEHAGVYLITGGLGGVGLVIAEHLAREFKARLVLLSRSAMPPESQWETSLNDEQLPAADRQRIRQLLEIRSHAGEMLLIQADVANVGQMRGAVALARKQFGKIDGVFHAAGVLEDGPLMLKTAESAARVLSPKVRGTLALEEALGDSPLSCFVLFSSVSSILPPAGQVDYAAGNAFLDAFALSRNGRVTVINWGPWRDVGMAARSNSPHPWLERRLLQTPTKIVYTSQFSTDKQWLLPEHRLKSGNALIVGTGYLELVAGAYSRDSMKNALEFQDVFFLAPLVFQDHESREVRVQLERESKEGAGKEAFQFSVLAQAGDWVEHARGQIAPCPMPPSSVDRSAILSRCHEREMEFDELHRTRQERYFDFGPRWRCLKRIHFGTGEGLAELRLDASYASDLVNFRIHPALLDLATGCSLYLTEGYEHSEAMYLPFSYKRMRVYHPLPLRFFSHIRALEGNRLEGDMVTFDITLFDEQDDVLVEIDGFALRRMEDAANQAEKNTWASDVSQSGGELRVESYDQPGIEPLVGARALVLLLNSETSPAVVVTAHPLDSMDTRDGARVPQTVDSSPPDETVERTLANWWQQMLGVESVGLGDDFFGLGGHSLVGVRLFAKIKKTYGVDLQLATLFEARTVRQLAERIRKAMHPATVETRDWSALVPIQPKGSRIPLFLIHASGGDVLLYEQLARALGPEQPLYGFRSALFSKPEIFETTIEELASVYVKELRAFLPQGPYLLGGVSLGGIIAFEMSQQLDQEGFRPELLLLIDPEVPGSTKMLAADEQLKRFWETFRNEGSTYLMRKARMKGKYWVKVVRDYSKHAKLSLYRFAGRDLPTTIRLLGAHDAHMRALGRYAFRTYPGNITLIRATRRGDALSRRDDPTLGWQRFAAGELQIHDVYSDHVSMLFEPQVRAFAEKLKTILANLEATYRNRKEGS